MSDSAFPPQFSSRLARGKYTRWAVDLPEDTLEALLWMIGEYGIRAASFLQFGEGEMPDPIPSSPLGNVRAKEALRTIAGIVSGDRMDVEGACHRIRLAVAAELGLSEEK